MGVVGGFGASLVCIDEVEAGGGRLLVARSGRDSIGGVGAIRFESLRRDGCWIRSASSRERLRRDVTSVCAQQRESIALPCMCSTACCIACTLRTSYFMV